MVDRSCRGTNAAGARCDAKPVRASGWCFWHDPALEAERTEGRRQGGRQRSHGARAKKAMRGAGDVAPVLWQALNDLAAGTLEPARGTAMAAVSRALIAAHEVAEIESRLAALEALAATTERGKTG